MLYKTVKY